MVIKGTVVEIKELQVISEKFKKQEVIIKQEGESMTLIYLLSLYKTRE